MRFKQYLTEAKRFVVTIKDIKNVGGLDRTARQTAEFLEDYWYEQEGGKKEVSHFLQMMSRAGAKALKILGKVPHYERKSLISNMLSREMLPEKEDDLWPISIYVSSSPNDPNTVGILVWKNGKKEMFEGNDLATDDTYDLVDQILGKVKEVTVWGQHGIKTVEQIKKTGKLPKGLYMSPKKSYASGYWSTEEERVLFSCIAPTSAFRRESDVDWRVKKDFKCKQIKLF